MKSRLFQVKKATFQLTPRLRIPDRGVEGMRAAQGDRAAHPCVARMRCAAWTSLIDMNRVEELVSPGDAKCCAQSQLRQLTVSPLSFRPRLG